MTGDVSGRREEAHSVAVFVSPSPISRSLHLLHSRTVTMTWLLPPPCRASILVTEQAVPSSNPHTTIVNVHTL